MEGCTETCNKGPQAIEGMELHEGVDDGECIDNSWYGKLNEDLDM